MLTMPVRAFVSYAHVDDARRERLHRHLAMLRRDGLIGEWTDHEILAGSPLDDDIAAALDQAGLFIGLLSPDYLHSDYCYEKEFARALELQTAGRLRIVGIVVEPCDWKNSPFGKLKVLPKDGKAIPDWTNENNAYLNVVDELRRIVSQPAIAAANPLPTAGALAPSGRRYRVKQDFDAIQKSEFAENAFKAMASYFESACAEMHGANEHLRAKFQYISPSAFTCSVVNRAKMHGGDAHLTMHLNRGQRGFGGISWVWQAHADAGTSNGQLSVEADDYELALSGANDGHGFGGREEQERKTPQTAAEQLWNALMQKAGIELAD